MRLAVALLLAILPAALLHAHDIETRIEILPPVVLVHVTYAGTDPVSHAEASVLAPDGVEHQNGRTDALGRFSFVPDREGAWRFVVDDELGHRQEIEIAVSPDNLAGAAHSSSAALSLTQRLFTGLSLIFGATGLLFWWKARRPAGRS
ncbi:MAG: hypothetical protein ACK5AZ_13520 [Bryobacteraceae bacterium]